MKLAVLAVALRTMLEEDFRKLDSIDNMPHKTCYPISITPNSEDLVMIRTVLVVSRR